MDFEFMIGTLICENDNESQVASSNSDTKGNR